MTASQEILLRQVNKKLDLLLKTPAVMRVQEWGSYEEACKVLNRSKTWYKGMRFGEKALLVKGVDWRSIGRTVEYRLQSIERLKNELSK